ncbi:Uncharacterised protein [Mycobacteroides abscessus subsp. massiliense]|nr:Uncharacterised protein [Mycobacteroides abscessus subsp. abscessus]SKQ86920.1 Uncharacterised protein [Mycobacteroides abscessus subsp. massiliense]SLC47778.1 Uncharacterised protein [Mycobacteroides abscessus subsp. massiliense]
MPPTIDLNALSYDAVVAVMNALNPDQQGLKDFACEADSQGFSDASEVVARRSADDVQDDDNQRFQVPECDIEVSAPQDGWYGTVAEAAASQLFERATAERRAAELFDCLSGGGAAYVDRETDRLVLIVKNVSGGGQEEVGND